MAVKILLSWQILVHFRISKEAEIILLPYTPLSQWVINKISRHLFQSVENVALPVKYQLKKARSRFYETENMFVMSLLKELFHYLRGEYADVTRLHHGFCHFKEKLTLQKLIVQCPHQSTWKAYFCDISLFSFRRHDLKKKKIDVLPSVFSFKGADFYSFPGILFS